MVQEVQCHRCGRYFPKNEMARRKDNALICQTCKKEDEQRLLKRRNPINPFH